MLLSIQSLKDNDTLVVNSEEDLNTRVPIVEDLFPDQMAEEEHMCTGIAGSVASSTSAQPGQAASRSSQSISSSFDDAEEEVREEMSDTLVSRTGVDRLLFPV